MVRKINFRYIGEISKLIIPEIMKLKELEQQLLADISEINNYYKGGDSDITVEKYKKETKYIY